jgi:hypothetical protein
LCKSLRSYRRGLCIHSSLDRSTRYLREEREEKREKRREKREEEKKSEEREGGQEGDSVVSLIMSAALNVD